jgi:hypothetical protein
LTDELSFKKDDSAFTGLYFVFSSFNWFLTNSIFQKKSSVFRYMRQTDNNRTPADIASGQKTRRKNYSASTLRALVKKKL